MKLWKVAARNIGRNRRRSLLSGFAIAVAAMAFLMLSAILAGLSEDIKQNVQTYYSGAVRIRNREFDKHELLLPLHLDVQEYEQVITTVEGLAGIESVVPRISFPTAVYRQDTNFRASGIGIDIDREKEFMKLENIIASGNMPDPAKKEILIGEGLAHKMDVSAGDKITTLSKTRSRGTNAFTFRITGTVRTPVQALNDSLIFAPMEQVQRFLKMHGGVTEILVKLDSRTDPEKAANELNAVFEREGFSTIAATPWTKIKSSYAFVEMAESAYFIIALVLFILGSTVIVNTTMMVVYERVREIGTVSAMGMYSREVVGLFFLEAFFISLLGSIAGIAIGMGITIPMSMYGLDLSGAFGTLNFEMSPVLFPVLKINDIVIVFVYSVSIASFASIFPSLRASRVEPVEALRTI